MSHIKGIRTAMRMHSGAVGAQIAALRGVAKKQENSNVR